MTLTMKDITDACAALKRFKYESGPYGVTSPPPGSKGVSPHEYVRIESLSGIAGPGRWRIRRLPGGEPISGIISNKRQLRTALLEWRAEEEDGPRPNPRDGYTVYAHDNGVRTSIGMANAIIWSYRKTRRSMMGGNRIGMVGGMPARETSTRHTAGFSPRWRA